MREKRNGRRQDPFAFVGRRKSPPSEHGTLLNGILRGEAVARLRLQDGAQHLRDDVFAECGAMLESVTGSSAVIYFREVQRPWPWVLLLFALATPAIVVAVSLHRAVAHQGTSDRILYLVCGPTALLALWFSLACLIVEVRETRVPGCRSIDGCHPADDNLWRTRYSVRGAPAVLWFSFTTGWDDREWSLRSTNQYKRVSHRHDFRNERGGFDEIGERKGRRHH
jgi:hypothetical protein